MGTTSLKINELKDGDLFLVNNYPDNLETSVLPFLIRKATREYYHHCAIYFEGYVYQSIAKGVTKTHTIADYLDGIGKVREVAICRYPNFDKEAMLEQVGRKYNFGATLFWQPIYQITNDYFGKSNPKRRNCSQFAAKCFGLDWWASADPQDLAREAFQNNYVILESAPKRREYVNSKNK